MKKIDTAYISNGKADLEEIKKIIKNLFTKEGEEWLCLFDTSKKNPNYIQIHSDIEEYEEDALNFLHYTLEMSLEEFDNIENIYLIEYRRYEDGENFKHYRSFSTDANLVYSYFEKYMNNKLIETNNWLDVTEEFDE